MSKSAVTYFAIGLCLMAALKKSEALPCGDNQEAVNTFVLCPVPAGMTMAACTPLVGTVEGTVCLASVLAVFPPEEPCVISPTLMATSSDVGTTCLGSVISCIDVAALPCGDNQEAVNTFVLCPVPAGMTMAACTPLVGTVEGTVCLASVLAVFPPEEPCVISPTLMATSSDVGTTCLGSVISCIDVAAADDDESVDSSASR